MVGSRLAQGRENGLNRATRGVSPIDPDRQPAYLGSMNYLLAIFLPPLSLLFAGRFISAILIGVLWFVAVVSTIVLFPFTVVVHLIFVVLAWVMISRARSDRRHRELLRAMQRR